MTDEIVKYIVRNRSKGHSDGAIKDSLRSVGYSANVISEAFETGDKKTQKSSLFSNLFAKQKETSKFSDIFPNLLVAKPSKEPKTANPFDYKDVPFINLFNNKKVVIPLTAIALLVVVGIFAFENPVVKGGFMNVVGRAVKVFTFEGTSCNTNLVVMMLEGSEKVCYINSTTGIGIQFLLHNRGNATIDSVNVIIDGSRKTSRFNIGGPIEGGNILAKVVAYDYDEYGDIGMTEMVPVIGEKSCDEDSLKMNKIRECVI